MLALAHEAPTWILPFIFVLTIVVTVHEFGHFIAARLCGVAVDQFSIGFGRAIVKRRDRQGTEWRIGWIPLGGYVRFAGDENAASVPDSEDLDELRKAVIAHEGVAALKRYYAFKPIWQRAIIAAAGPFANFGLSIGLLATLFLIFGEAVVPAKITAVMPNSPAAAGGFMPGDIVVKAAGRTIESFPDLTEVVVFRTGIAVPFEVMRGGKAVDLVATPRSAVISDGFGGHQEGGQLGLESRPTAADVIHKRFGPVEALGRGVSATWDVFDTTLFYLKRVVQGQVSASQLHGPLGVAQMSHDVAKLGAQDARSQSAQIGGSLIALLYMVAFYSVGIGFANLLPIPVLDGGHLLFYAYEAVARRPVGARVQAVSYRVGLALVLGLMLVATTNDLQRSGVFHFLGGPFS